MRERLDLTPGRIALLAVLAALLALVVAGPPLWSGAADEIDTAAMRAGASAAHPFGTDQLGRDLLARVLVATRLSLLLALATAALGFALGVAVGLLPALLGPRLRSVVATTINLFVAIPGLLLALLVATIVGIGAKGAVIALGVALAPQAARLTQTLAASVGGAEYVAASRVVGVRWPRLLGRHILPNIAAPLVLQFAMATSQALLALSALSFLGLGVQSPDYDWGALLSVGLDRMYVTPMAALGPGLAIVLAGVAINAGGDVLAAAIATDAPQRARRRRRAAGLAPSATLAAPVAEALADEAAPAAAASAAAAPAAAAPAADAAPGDVPAAPAVDPAPAPPAPAGPPAALRVERLSVSLPAAEGAVTPVREVSLTVGHGERVGIVGESGSGKSLTALAAAALLEPPFAVETAAHEIAGEPLFARAGTGRRRLLGRSLAVVFQDPLSALNPALRLRRQLTEAAIEHRDLDAGEATEAAIERLRELRLTRPEQRLGQHPHELSGGMRQRAVIAMGMTVRPGLIVADEPTTALDVAVEREVLAALRRANDEDGTAILLISHDIGVIASFCERVLVMYGGRIVEELPAADLRERAVHPYTRALLAAVPDMETDRDRPLPTIPGRPPTAAELPASCAFAARCAFASERCRAQQPPLVALDGAPGRRVACWHPAPDAAAPAPAAAAGDEREEERR
ncbi:dipeptide/oligopeptide/nickel ABC transporter permease/ATP-binding protein [Conexibacter arvalis]|uniref:Oligopeptide/dipeptide ABC transporter ATP-binding protein n=1 Tax=Conexibacter arvalis TaxID=912552 RepID=A0A840IME1_9ACTN|nr:dipeptide/oligopeptide/nickel ABC transporter permease/ATP-binding protein [Conexibacter arvalis]MBB4665128.1 oligopeptide/dipeptide ABC transporter ATP-binding protein [Conexibacter arvalis]